MKEMISRINEIRNRLSLFNLIVFTSITLLSGSYFLSFMMIKVNLGTYYEIDSIFTLVQVSMILAIAITMYLLANIESKLMKISALITISLIIVIGVMRFISFFRIDSEFFQRILTNSNFLLMVYSCVVVAFLSFFRLFEELKQREKIFSWFGFLWSIIVILILFASSLNDIAQAILGAVVIAFSSILIFLNFFFSEKLKIAFPKIPFSIFIILIFNYQFGFFAQIFQPDSIGSLVSRFSAVFAYIFGFWALVKSIAAEPKAELQLLLIEREKVMSSLQSIVRHDAANYLATAISFIEISFDNNSSDFLERAIKSIEKAMILLDHTTNIAKQYLESKKEIVSFSPILTKICEEIQQDKDSFDKEIVEINVTLENVNLEYHPIINGVIKNILENALKYTPGKKASINISSLISEERGSKMFNLIFEDFGQGIHPELKEQILKKPVESERGHGFGLFIYNYLIEKMLGGEIIIKDRVKNDYTKGTRVTLSLPLKM